MKILHINEHLARKGGVETYLFALLPMLEARGMRCHYLYADGDPGHWPDSSRVPAVRRPQAAKEAYRKVSEVLRRVRPDVVHVHNAQNEGVPAACLDYGPTVLTTHDYRWVCPANTFFYKRTREVCLRTCGPGCFTTTLHKHCLTPRLNYAVPFYRRVRWAGRNGSRFARVIAPSHGARARYVEAGFPPDRIPVVPYFCPVEPAEAPRPVPARPTITFLGRIAPNKGQEYFVEALGMLPSEVRGVMVGNLGEGGEAAMQALAERFGCADRLELRGWASREEVRQLLDETSVFIFPSLWPETLGIVGLEALSRGVPVVASNLGGTSEWCLEGETGYRVPPKDARAIRDAVLKLIVDEKKLQAFGRRGIDLIRERFLPGTHVNTLSGLYQEAATRRTTHV
jgi:glycosyltransferase involved in cell wall biosynthesis